MNELSIIVEKLLVYAKEHLDLDELDLIYTRNLLLNKLNHLHIGKLKTK